MQRCTWLFNLAPCYWELGVVEQSVLSHVQSDTCCLKKVVVTLPRLCGRLADDSLITALGEQPAMSGHGGCLSTGVVLCQFSRVKVPIHTSVVRPCVFLGVLPFRCQGSSIWVSWCRPGRFSFTPPLLRCLKRYPQCYQGVAVDITFKGCIGTHMSQPTKAISPVSSSSCCPPTLRVSGVFCVARQAGHIGDSSWTWMLTHPPAGVRQQCSVDCSRAKDSGMCPRLCSSTAWWSFQLCATDNVFSRFISAHS